VRRKHAWRLWRCKHLLEHSILLTSCQPYSTNTDLDGRLLDCLETAAGLARDVLSVFACCIGLC
jgi:hypothetical protein